MKKSVLITGTTSGIGRGLMEHYSRKGWHVVAFNRREDRELETGHPGARFVRLDVRDREGIRTCLGEAAAHGELPELYYLNAGINKVDNLGGFDVEVFRVVLDVNLLGVLHFVDAALPHLEGRRATFVACSSTSNIFPNPNCLGYFVSKLALAKTFRLLDTRYRGRGWSFKTLILGPVATNLFVSGALGSRFQSRVREAITVRVEDAIAPIVRFAHSRRRVLYYPKPAVAVFGAAALASALLPGLYSGSAPAKSQG